MTVAIKIPDNVETLEKLVIHLATLYDRGEDCVDFDGNLVPDPDYDELIRTLQKRKPDSVAFAVGATSPSEYVPEGDTVTHHPPMTSISKADGENKVKIYSKWIKDCCEELGYTDTENKFVQSYKHDGVAIRIYYEKGKLVKAGLRPRNGVDGIDVTRNAKYVKGIPQKLPQPWTLAVTGELECHLEDFQQVQDERAAKGEELRKNPRNHTYGSINQHKDPRKTKEGKISFIGYNIVNFDESAQYYKTEYERAKWANQVLKVPFVRVERHSFDDLEKMEAMVGDLVYEVDGIVIKVNNLEDQEQLGNAGDDPTGDPRGALAWKFKEEEKNAEVDNIDWNASRTGFVVPTAVFKEGIHLAGTTVTRATCNNYGWISRMQIGAGTIVTVIKAGKIIPKVIGVVKGQVNQVNYPTVCPTCSSQLMIVEGADDNQSLKCNNKGCPAKHIKTYVFYLTSLGAKGLGESALEKIIGSGVVTSMDQLYTLTVKDLIATDEFTERQATLAIATIHMVKPVKDNDKLLKNIEKARSKKKEFDAWKFFGALGIPGAGKTVGKSLVAHFKSFDAIRTATFDELVEIDGIGDKTAQVIVDWFKENDDMVGNLLNHVELVLPKSGHLSGKTFVLTGSFDLGKSYWENQIHEVGGETSSSVSAKIDYVVAGPKAGSKLDKANEKNIPVLDVDGLQKLLQGD